MIVIIIQMIFLKELIGPMVVTIVFFRGLSSICDTAKLAIMFRIYCSMELVNKEFKNLNNNKEESGFLNLEIINKYCF